MRILGLALAVVFAGTSLMAEVVQRGDGEACPVGFAAAVNGRAIAHSAKDEKTEWPAPLVELSFGRRGLDVVGATVTIHGEVPSGRYLPVGQGRNGSRTQTFDLDGMSGARGVTVREVVVGKMALVRWAELTELRFADGSVWHPRGEARCRAFPRAARLIDAEAD